MTHTTATIDALPFQARVHDWILACFGAEIGADKIERNHRFIEEALELVQSTGCTQSEAHQLVDYVYGRPVGDPFQEVGGVMNTLAALCTAYDIDLVGAAETELARVWTKVEKIRAKQAAKPKHSPLPENTAPTLATELRAALVREAAALEREQKLREAAEWLLRHVTGKDLRMKGIVLQDTSDIGEFLAAQAALGTTP